jgi:hypothetical protein
VTITNGYCDLTQLGEALGANVSDTANLERSISAASRWIDQHCGRRFYADALATARKFMPRDASCCPVDDIHTTTGLVVKTSPVAAGTYGITLAATDYVLSPYSGVGANGATGWPYTEITTSTTWTFNGALPAVEVTAKWGWAAVPDDVVQAAIAAAEFVYKSKDAPFGAAGVADLGITRARMPSIVLDLLAGYRKYGAAGTPFVA